ncbi:MAG: hypothetical protein M1825_001980 [Sarcosagium campestre]|nr:MAG: hypothetical protein M1825_001980 [Sarcosagium campestre]
MTTPIIVMKGDLFDAPPGSVLIHACNAVGSWGGDIAAKFKQRYPAAFKVYKEHCDTSRYGASDLVGTCLLIPPLHKDYRLDPAKRHWIACLFTSENYGCRVDPKRSILQATKISFCDLLEQYQIESRDSNRTYVHLNQTRVADVFEEFSRDHLPLSEIYVPPHLQPVNPEDEDDVVPDQHAAYGITRATQRAREPVWRDLGLEALLAKSNKRAESDAAAAAATAAGNPSGGGGSGGGGAGGQGALPR